MRCRVAGSAAPAVIVGLSDDAAHGPLRPQSRQSAVACCAPVRRRIAFIDYFATHYRKRLYEELARRMEVDFYFFADERERYWNRKIPLVREGDFRRVELRRYRVAGEAVMPGLALALQPRRYDAVVKSLNGKLMLPLVYGASRARGLPFVLWTGMWHHPHTGFHRVTRPLTRHVYRGAEAIVAYGEQSSATSSKRPKWMRARSSWPGRQSSLSASPPCGRRATARRRCCSSASSRSARVSPTCWSPSPNWATSGRGCGWWATARSSPR